MILGEYMKSGDTEKALQYISSAQNDLDRLTPKQYCKNKSTNLILSYYQTLAEKSGIRYEVGVKIPEGQKYQQYCSPSQWHVFL